VSNSVLRIHELLQLDQLVVFLECFNNLHEKRGIGRCTQTGQTVVILFVRFDDKLGRIAFTETLRFEVLAEIEILEEFESLDFRVHQQRLAAL
jgi:hypothetical protein